MAKKSAGSGGMPAEIEVREVPLAQAQAIIGAQALEEAPMANTATQAGEGTPAQETPNFEVHVEGSQLDGAGRQPDFRVVQPEYLESEGKTIFKDVGALWKNISRKTGREFYTMKIGKLKLLVFPNQKLEQKSVKIE